MRTSKHLLKTIKALHVLVRELRAENRALRGTVERLAMRQLEHSAKKGGPCTSSNQSNDSAFPCLF